MSDRHEFVVGTWMNICRSCGRDRNDYQYHLEPKCPAFVDGKPIDSMEWIYGLLDIVALYRAGYSPDYLADSVIEKYRQWPVEERYRLKEYKPFEGETPNGLCGRVVGALDRLAHEMAYDHASSAVECAALTDEDGWMELSDLEEHEKKGVERDFLYLDQRGLIERHSEKKEWFQIRDESEAAIDIEDLHLREIMEVRAW